MRMTVKGQKHLNMELRRAVEEVDRYGAIRELGRSNWRLALDDDWLKSERRRQLGRGVL